MVLHSYIGKEEADSHAARQQFLLTMAAIGCSFSKNGSHSAQKILKNLEGPGLAVEDIMEDLSDTQVLVLFGKDELEKRHGNSPDSD